METITPTEIAEELCSRAETIFAMLSTLLEKKNGDAADLKRKIGVAASILFNLTSQKMSVYATKLGVMLIASGNQL